MHVQALHAVLVHVQALDPACQQALAPWIHDQSAQGTKTGCLQKMLSIINHVYQAAKRLQTDPERNTGTKTSARLLRNTLLSLCAFDLEMNGTFPFRPKCCYCSSGVAQEFRIMDSCSAASLHQRPGVAREEQGNGEGKHL